MKKIVTLPVILVVIIAQITITSIAAQQQMVFRSFAQSIDMDGVKEHLNKFEQISNQYNNNRVTGSRCYDQAALYVATKLWLAGYKIRTQQFKIMDYVENSTPVFEQISPQIKTYNPNSADGFYTLKYSGKGDVSGSVQAVDIVLPPGQRPNTSNSGCEMEDFKDFIPGKIALLQRGTCTYRSKALNAQNAGAIGVIIFNEGQPGRMNAYSSTLSDTTIKIPVIVTSFAIGKQLCSLSQTQDVKVHVKVDGKPYFKKTSNIIVETKQGDSNSVALFGAHIDGVPNCPAINDNATPVACLMEIAKKLIKTKMQIKNKIRFCFWSAEEIGLLGSSYYVNTLTEQELNKISLYMNYEMLGSSNYVRFIYDGDGSDSKIPGPPGSEIIEELYNNYFTILGLETERYPFDGRSDYQAFKDKGIAVGGLFSGAEGIKTPKQAEIYGGTAGLSYAPNYHKPDDNVANINFEVLQQNLDAITYAVYVCAIEDLPKNEYRSLYVQSNHDDECSKPDYVGPYLIK